MASKKKPPKMTQRIIASPDAQWSLVKDAAWRERVSMAAWVRQAIDEKLAKVRKRAS